MLKRFRKNQEGVAAVEFALIAPMLLTFYLGVVELTNYMKVERRAEMTANSMAQVLGNSGSGAAWAMHQSWQIPVQINPTQHLNYRWGQGKVWRVPFSFSQIEFDTSALPTRCKPGLVIDDPECMPEPERDFIFAFGGSGMFRSCDVKVIPTGNISDDNRDLPEVYVQRGTPVMMVGHVARYKPYFLSFFEEALGFETSFDDSVEIKKIAYSNRYDGEVWNYPNNRHGMYRKC